MDALGLTPHVGMQMVLLLKRCHAVADERGIDDESAFDAGMLHFIMAARGLVGGFVMILFGVVMGAAFGDPMMAGLGVFAAVMIPLAYGGPVS